MVCFRQRPVHQDPPSRYSRQVLRFRNKMTSFAVHHASLNMLMEQHLNLLPWHLINHQHPLPWHLINHRQRNSIHNFNW